MTAAKCIYFGICVALFAALIEAYFIQDGNREQPEIKPEVAAIDSIEGYKKLNPGVQVEELQSISLNATYRKIYALGSRIAGDQLVAYADKNQSWITTKDVELTLQYPRTGDTGALITNCYFVVDQSSDSGKAAVVAGGLHQRTITIIVEAFNVTFMNIDGQIYGLV